MSAPIIVSIAAKEIRDAVRNRWFALSSAAFAALALALAYLALAGAGSVGMGGFGRTAAGLINLVLFIVPLMALTAGAGTLAGERDRGTLQLLLSQPISRTEAMFGKYAGLAGAMLVALTIGFGLSGLVMAWRGGSAQVGAYAALIGLTFLLAISMLSVGVLISSLAPRAPVAIGTAIFVWLLLVLLSDLGLMGSAIVFKLQAHDLFHLALINPAQAFKLSAVSAIEGSLEPLGPAGTYAVRTYGQWLPALLASSLAAWTIAPLALAMLVFSRRSVV